MLIPLPWPFRVCTCISEQDNILTTKTENPHLQTLRQTPRRLWAHREQERSPHSIFKNLSVFSTEMCQVYAQHTEKNHDSRGYKCTWVLADMKQTTEREREHFLEKRFKGCQLFFVLFFRHTSNIHTTLYRIHTLCQTKVKDPPGPICTCGFVRTLILTITNGLSLS